MRWFLVDIAVPDPDRTDLERATRTLRAAQGRSSTGAARLRPLMAGVITEGGRLVCLIEAPSIPAVRRLLALALLPGGRIREVRRRESLTPRRRGLRAQAEILVLELSPSLFRML
jgi:hypothetical protein